MNLKNQKMNKTQKTLTFLQIYAGLLTVALAVVMYYVFFPSPTKHLKTLTVERINVVEKNGDLKLVISNSKRQHPGAVNGKKFPKRKRPAGLIFFNSQGDECGGLIYDGNDNNAGMVLSVDKYRDDQVMQLRYVENTKKHLRTYGLQFWDFPKEDSFEPRNKAMEALKKLKDPKARSEAFAKIKASRLLPENRMFVGKKMNKDVGLFINDSDGHPRIKIYIDKDNQPRIELLDEKGKTVRTL